jgi:hypothetical protein
MTNWIGILVSAVTLPDSLTNLLRWIHLELLPNIAVLS